MHKMNIKYTLFNSINNSNSTAKLLLVTGVFPSIRWLLILTSTSLSGAGNSQQHTVAQMGTHPDIRPATHYQVTWQLDLFSRTYQVYLIVCVLIR
jgi:hypothetical protein